MDIGNTAWVDEIARQCDIGVTEGFDGCFLDVLGLGPFWMWSNVPINPITGSIYTMAEWNQASLRLAEAVRDHLNPHPVMGNGLGAGWRYWDPSMHSSAYFTVLDRMTTEGFLRYPNDPVTAYRTEGDWKKDVDMLVDAGSRGKQVFVITTIGPTATQAEKDAWHRYTLASFLLGTDGRQRFSFRYAADADPTFVHPWWGVDLGTPTGPYAKVDGVYQRVFSKGKVLVNPTGAPHEVILERTYVDLQGTSITSVTLAPYDAEILRAL
jgi:hypothetical protein